MADFTIGQGDLLPEIQATLLDANNVAVDLTAASGVIFRLKAREDGTVVIDAAGSIVAPATSGIVKYTWQTGDTDDEGDYDAEWEVTFAGKTMTFPNTDKKLWIAIGREIG